MRTRARTYASPAKPPPRHRSPPAKVRGPLATRSCADAVTSLLGASVAALIHGVAVDMYGHSCGIKLFLPHTWLMGMTTVNSTWCTSLHWLCGATSACTDKMATSVCMFVALRFARSR